MTRFNKWNKGMTIQSLREPMTELQYMQILLAYLERLNKLRKASGNETVTKIIDESIINTIKVIERVLANPSYMVRVVEEEVS